MQHFFPFQIRERPSLNYWAYVQVFTPVGWAATFCLLLALSITYLIIQFFHSESLKHSSDPESFGIMNSIGLVGTLQLQLTYPLRYSFCSLKILFLSTSMTCYFLYAGYTALMTSEMTYTAPPPKWESLAVR